MQSLGVVVPKAEAEAVRRMLVAAGALRSDLKVAKDAAHILFPVHDVPPTLDGHPGLEVRDHEFQAQTVRPDRYQDLLPWSDADRSTAPRAYDRVGDIVVLKVPDAQWSRRRELGAAILRFHRAVRAVFHDHGVKGPFRTRELERIAGEGTARTEVHENGVRLQVDLERAYFSPRLADERARVVAQVRAGQQVVDLFGGVGPAAVQAAKVGAEVVCVDLNPDACALARQNAETNHVAMRVVQGDSREVGPDLGPADHVLMNLPHGAKDFLDVALQVVGRGGVIHHNEILPDADLEGRKQELVAGLTAMLAGGAIELRTVRHVRQYASDQSHYAFDLAVMD